MDFTGLFPTLCLVCLSLPVLSKPKAMAKELGLGDSELTFAQANCQAMDMAQLQDVSEMLNMRG